MMFPILWLLLCLAFIHAQTQSPLAPLAVLQDRVDHFTRGQHFSACDNAVGFSAR
jgi:hypothetical protein